MGVPGIQAESRSAGRHRIGDALLIGYQMFLCNMLKVKLFFAAVLELCKSENSSNYESSAERQNESRW